MQREIIKPQFDTPIVVKLDFGADGIQRDGKYGLEYQYTLNDNSCVMWLPKQGRDALMRTNAQAGDLVQILKTKRGGQTLFNAQVMSDAMEDEPEPTQPVRANGQMTPVQTTTVRRPLNGATATPVEGAGGGSPIAQQLARCLLDSVEAALEVERYAASKGKTLQFNEEDIRAIGLSVYIGAQRAGR